MTKYEITYVYPLEHLLTRKTHHDIIINNDDLSDYNEFQVQVHLENLAEKLRLETVFRILSINLVQEVI